MSRILKSKVNIRKQIIFALAHGTGKLADSRTDTPGLIQQLLTKTSEALSSLDTENVEGLAKLGQLVIRLSSLAMPTAYQAEALEKGLAPGANNQISPTDIIALLEKHLAERRQLLKPIVTNAIDVTHKSSNIKDLARIELDKRLTPPPVPPPGQVVGELEGRGPTSAKIDSEKQVSGTKVTFDISKIQDDPLPEMDI